VVMEAQFFRNIRLISLVRSLSCDRRQISRIVNVAAGKYDVRRDFVMGKKIEEYCRNRICVFLTISLFISSLTIGAEQTAPKTGREKLRTRVTYSCIDTPIEKVLMDLADQAKIDIIKSPSVTCNVTVTVTDVPLEEALTNILAAYDYTYIATENMVRILPLPPQTEEWKEPQVTKIYKITYANVDEVAAALDDFTSKKAEIGINKGTSHIAVTDTEDKIRAIDKFIEQIDRMTSQVLVEVRIYDVTSKEGFELNPQWHVGRNAPYIPGTIKETTESVTGEEISDYEQKQTDMRWYTLGDYPDANYVGIGFPSTAPELLPIVERKDNTTTTDAARTDTETRYMDYSGIADWKRKPFVGGSFDRVTGGTLSFSVLNDAIDLNFVLSVLHSQLEARLLANPRILVLDNETANFRIVREIPYKEYMQVGREDPVDFTAFKDVGVNLKVTPHIARDGMLRLDIVPEFSVLVNQDLEGVPTVDARRANTKAMIKDGQTIAIGGLRKREITKNIAKVPVLGDIPLLGGLFTSESESKVVNELIVFITTKIITEPALSESEQKLLSETKFTTPLLEKTRIEKGEFEKNEAEESDITDSLDLLLEKLEPSRN
jgi:type II secretory pathway component GspD/PulD (secretin)